MHKQNYAFSLFIFFFLSFSFPAESFAMRDVDSLAGDDQRFSVENSQEVFAETFHQKELLSGSAIIDESRKQPLGSWRFHKQFRTNVLHDDNYSASYRDPRPETIYTYSPTVGVSHRRDHTFVKLFYNLAYSDFVQNQKSSRFNQSQTTSIRLNYNRLNISFENAFKPDSAFVQGEHTELKTTDGKSVITYYNGALLTADYKFSPKTKISLSYGNDLFYFPSTGLSATDNSSQSTMTHRVIPKVAYRLTPKTNIFVDYKFTYVDYFKGGAFGSRENAGDIGIEGRLFSGIGASLSMGYANLDFMDAATPSNNGLNFQFALSKKVLPKVQATLSMTQEVGKELGNTAFESTRLDKNFYGLNLTWKATPHISVETEGSVGYVNKDGMITLPDLDNRTVNFTRPREDQMYKWGVKLMWAPRPFFDLLIAYEYLNQNSSFKDFEYYAHRIAGYLNYRF